MVAPSGEQFEIVGGGYRAVVTECGAGLRILEYDGRPLVAGFREEERATYGAGQLLVPWPNRIGDGAYTFRGEDQQLGLTEPSRHNAMHGLARWAAWTLEEKTGQSVSLVYRLMAQSGYPWTLDLHVLYDVSADGLTVTVTATNLSGAPAPYAFGAHPYLTVGDDGVDRWELTVPATVRMLVDERKLPAGREDVSDGPFDFRVSRPIRGTELDHAFTGLTTDEEGRAEVRLSHPRTGDGVALWADRSHPWLQVYTADDLPAPRRAVAVEPMTAPPDAFRTGEDLVVLGPAGSSDDEHSCSWGIRTL